MASIESYRHSRAEDYQRQCVWTGKRMPQRKDGVVERARAGTSATHVQDCFGSRAATLNEGGN